MAKLKVLGEKPPAVPDKRLQELRDYIFRIIDELEYLLTHLDEDNLSEVLVRRLRGYEESIEHIEQSIPNAYNGDPEMDSTASPGSSGAWARGDHVHPSDSSKANETELATVETAPNASNNFVKGDLFSLDGVFCQAKTAISSGEAFTLGTNYEETTVAKQFRTTKMFYLSQESGTTSSLGNLNLALNPNAIVVGFRPSQQQAVSFFGRGSNGNYFAHMVNSSGSNITNTAVTLDVYYILP